MKEIETLGIEIERAWQAADFREGAFADIAETALAAHPLRERLAADSLVRWLSSPSALPLQVPDSGFGEPAIRLYTGRRFWVDALFWNDGTTAIHQHGFSGVFQVIAGGSIHTPYTFRDHTAINSALKLGELTAQPSELLAVGDTRRILSGNRFIHSLFHLDRPSVTLVVRTAHDVGSSPQFSYYHPGIAYDPFVDERRLMKQMRLLDTLPHPSPATSALLRELVATADLHSMLTLLMHWFRRRPVDDGEAEELLAAVARRHEALAAHLRVAFKEARRQALVVQRRQRIHRREHRFLLALLLNVGSRAQILSLLAQAHPGVDPIARITTWLEEIVATPAGEGAGNPIGYDLGEAELKVFAGLLQERTPDEIVSSLRDEYDDVDEQALAIQSLCESLRGSALFQPLFRTAP